MQEVKELWQEEIVVRQMKWFKRDLVMKKLWNQTLKKRRFWRSEMTFLYAFVF